MRYWETLLEEDRGGLKIILDKTWEDIHPGQCFDDTVTDIDDMCSKIDRGDLDWFVARARVLVDGVELADACIGGLLYEDAREFLRDGMAEDLISDAVAEAQGRLTTLAKTFTMLAIKHSYHKERSWKP
jgi:hypothetical protein